MEYINILGLAAAGFITIANFPQTYKIIKTKSTEDISSMTYIFLVIGNATWLAYGIIQQDFPLIIGNSISTAMCGLILVFKITSRKVIEAVNEKIIPKNDETEKRDV